MTLYPVRVDVTSKDKQVRVNDSMLLDLTCLPIPPCPKLAKDMDMNDVLNDTIDMNSKHLASILLADMEVLPYSKVGKKRVALLNTYPEMKTKVEEQIASQLRIMFEKEDSVGSRKRRRIVADGGDLDGENINAHQGNASKEEKHDTERSGNGLIKVNIRLRENKLAVVDEFMVDTNDPVLSNPLFLAESIAKDLNLPLSMINAIAINIAEQLHGLQVDEQVEGMVKIAHEGKTIQGVEIPSKKPIDKNVPAAWSLEKDEHRISQRLYQVISKNNKSK